MRNSDFFRLRLLVCWLAICLPLLGCAQADTRKASPPYNRKSLPLGPAQYSPQANDLQIKLNSHSSLRGAHIEVEFTSKNSMAMRGTVRSQRQKRRASEIARKIGGPFITNQLRIQKLK